MLRYVKIPAACANRWLNMMKNDKFQYLVTPPTSKEQLLNQGEQKLFYLPSMVLTLNNGLRLKKIQSPTIFTLEDTLMENK